MDLDELLGATARPAWALSSDECVEVVSSTQSLINQLTAVQAAHVSELDSRGWFAKHGFASMRVWLRDQARISPAAAARIVSLGAQLSWRPAVADAMAAGALGAEQAAVIGETVDLLSQDVSDTAIVDECETRLLADAARFDPNALRLAADRVLAHVAPDAADAVERKHLAEAEARAHAARGPSLVPAGPSRMRITGTLDLEAAAIVRAALEPLSRPIPEADGGRDSRLAPQRRADALVEVCAHVLRGEGGGLPVTQLAVTVGFDVLRRELGVGVLDNGQRLSPAETRRPACSAAVLPAVMGSESEVLDLGRQQRLFSGALRRALILRDRGCAFPHCDRPPAWCDGHHLKHWSNGGATELANGVLLCRHHHRVVHHDGWDVRIAADSLPEFIPPSTVDPRRQPVRNHYHPLRT